MKLAYWRSIAAISTLSLALASFAACDGDDGGDKAEPEAPADAGGDATDPEADAAEPTADTPEPADTGAEPDAAPEPEAGGTYTADAKPIYAAKCTPCHTGSTNGGHDIGANYADANEDAGVCPDKTVAECTIVRIENGSMPLGKGCGGPVADDAANADKCVTETELATLKAWVAAGAPE